MKSKLSLLFILYLLCTGTWAANPAESTGVSPISNTVSQQLRCYGGVNVRNPSAANDTDWWDCSGGNNENYICPSGYVTVGLTTWVYSHWWGDEYRCYLKCASTYTSSSNCDWK